MNSFPSCPGCGATASRGFFGGPFRVFRCSVCLRHYCYKCPNSNEGRRCPNPKCGSKDAIEVGKVE
jgi:hypothetical protein